MAPPTREQLRKLLADPERVLSIIGLHVLTSARRSFRDQVGPDGRPWPARYPNQPEGKFLNTAGALQDLAKGERIKPRRYDKRPAGVDTGELRGRLTFSVDGGELKVGSDVPHARRFHDGGESRIILTQALGQRIADVLRKARGAEKRKAKNASREPVRTVEELRLGPVLGAIRRGDRVWITTSPPRPFIGLSQDDASDLAESIAIAARQEAGA